MLDIKFVRENPDLVKENIKKKFQDKKLPLVDEVYDMDIKYRTIRTEADEARSKVNTLSKEIGLLMRDKKLEEARAEKIIGHSLNAKVTLFAEGDLYKFIKENKELLQTVFIISNLEVEENQRSNEEKLGVKIEQKAKNVKDVGCIQQQ